MQTKASRMVSLISTAKHIYRDKSLVSNDRFDATEEDADDLIAIGFARRAEQKGTYKRRDMKAEQ